MKKTILLILAVLPIVLLVIIAFAGQILSLYQHISVERVEFIDRYGSAYTKDHVFTVEQGQTKETKIKIYPELASNTRVSYTSSDDSICTVDQNGVITGIHFGFATVTVKTDDGSKMAVLNINVRADVPYKVTLNKNELSMLEGEIYLLTSVVDAPVAVDKSVIYDSDRPDVVKVDSDGKLIAVGEGTAIITVTTVSGGVTDQCVVTVTNGEPDIYFDFSEMDSAQLINGFYVFSSPTLSMEDIKSCIKVKEHISIDDVEIKLQSGEATITDGVLTFTKPGGITIRAYVGDEENADAFTEVKLAYLPQSN